MTSDNKENWKCNNCYEAAYIKKYHTPIASELLHTPSINNVTVRTKIQVNIPTENSFASLSDDDLMDSHELNRSCPEISINHTETIEDMRIRMNSLQERLDIADNEIQLMLTENFELKKQISQYKNQIDKLTSICKSTSSSKSSVKCSTSRKRSKKQNIPKTRLDFTVAEEFQNQTIDPESNYSHSSPTLSSSYRDIMIPNNKQLMKSPECSNDTVLSTAETNFTAEGTTSQQNNQNRIPIDSAQTAPSSVEGKKFLNAPNTQVTTENTNASQGSNSSNNINTSIAATEGTSGQKKRTIHIIGDDQLLGLSATLTESRSGKWNDNYTCSGFIMTNASSAEILNYCKSVSDNMSKDDIVILSLGSNDRNPEMLHYNLCVLLDRLRKVSVYILPVSINPYLNEKFLNYNLKLWTQHVNNCTVIDTNHTILNKKEFLNYICYKLNILIDSKDYRLQFLDLKKIFSKSSHGKLPYKKGTIPYYFPIVEKQNTLSPLATTSASHEIDSVSKVEFFRS